MPEGQICEPQPTFIVVKEEIKVKRENAQDSNYSLRGAHHPYCQLPGGHSASCLMYITAWEALALIYCKDKEILGTERSGDLCKFTH